MAVAIPERWVSFFEIYAAPEGSRARLGTGTYKEIFSRNLVSPCMSCFFSHATGTFLQSFARFGLAHFDEVAQRIVCEYGSPFEEVGGPLWMVKMSDSLFAAGLAYICHNGLIPSQESICFKKLPGQQLRLIASPQAFAEISGDESVVDELAIHILFRGSTAAINNLWIKPYDSFT